MNDRLKKQIEFMLELDKMKNIYRQTYVLHEDRKENVPNTAGIWLSLLLYLLNIPTSLWMWQK